MTTKEKPVHGGNRERAEAEKAALAGASVPITNYTTRRGTISSTLLTGRGNALTGREIMRILALKDGRDVSSLVERERRHGVPICATCDSKRPGYYLPETPDELDAYNRSLRRRIKNVTATLDAMETALDDWTGQQRLDLPGGEEAE